jgi:CheY-like chemotaxis protein
MSGEKIFIVEDERIVADDLKRMLERMGYQVVGLAASAEEAIQKIEATKPELVLMDIHIQGSLDGIDVAEHVITQFDIPVIYLTAYADEPTVGRAKGTLPSGYILKPFDERGLKTTIEVVLYRNNMDRMMKNVEGWHAGILGNLNEAVMALDTKGNVIYMNKTAEGLTGHLFDKVFGKPLKDVLPPHLDSKESTIKDLEGNVMGTALVLKETNAQPSHVPSPH